MKKVLWILVFMFGFVVKVNATPIIWTENGHYYDYVPFSTAALTWHASRNAATNTKHLGNRGYLATITSAEENAFLFTQFRINADDQFAWIGGYEPNDNNVWKWADGPEAGVQFSQKDIPTAPFNYANWGGIEPNDHKQEEDYAMYNIGNEFAGIQPGEWGDASPETSNLDPVVGYLVEYDQPQSTVPEPATLLLFSTGIAGFYVRRQRS
jgi:hypothetical protein